MRTRRGFTLIELMLVVLIVGVLAALATYGVRRYSLASKTAEARNALGQMMKDAATATVREAMPSRLIALGGSSEKTNCLCASASSPVPASGPPQAAKYQSSQDEWTVDASVSGRGFACLRFSMSDAQFYQYAYAGTAGSGGSMCTPGASARATATGDLDGDGDTSLFLLQAQLQTDGTVLVAPTIRENSPEE